MVRIVFYFLLLRPVEYTGTTNNDTKFVLNNVYLCLENRKFKSIILFYWTHFFYKIVPFNSTVPLASFYCNNKHI